MIPSFFGSAVCQERAAMVLEEPQNQLAVKPVGLTQSLVAGRTIAAAAALPGGECYLII